jgi:hypothetical protein
MKKITFLRTLAVVAIVVEILNIFIYMMAIEAAISDMVEFLTYTNINIVVWASVCVVCFGLTLRSFGLKTVPGKVWLCFALGLLCWVIADVLYLYFQVIALLPEEQLFPTIADYFWSIGYFFVFLGIILQMRLASVKLARNEKIIAILIATLATIVSLIFVIIPVLESLIADSTLSYEYWFFSLDYPIFDLILIPLAVVLVQKYRGGQFSKSWILISLGFVVTAIYDSLFTYFEIFSEGYLLYTDLLYIGYYMILAIGAIYLRSSLKSVK